MGKLERGSEVKSFTEGEWGGYNVRESMWKIHFESEKEKDWEKMREVDSKSEREKERGGMGRWKEIGAKGD